MNDPDSGVFPLERKMGRGLAKGAMLLLAGLAVAGLLPWFTGLIAAIAFGALYAAGGILILLSLTAFGLVYLEAMHCGLPVVATVPGGHEDFLSDGRTGYLVPRDDTAALQQALARLVGNRELRRAMSTHNKAVAQRFSIAATATGYEKLFDRLARGTQPRARAAA